jgi:hypothetical protein
MLALTRSFPASAPGRVAQTARRKARPPPPVGPPAAPGTASRIDAIDFWRGFALVTIFIDHVPENIFQYATYRNFGFSDAAELFVFLSGASVALAYGSRFFRGETTTAIRAVLRRAFTLYWVQCLISLLIIGLFAAAAIHWNNDEFLKEADRDIVVATPLRGLAAMLALTHQLGNVNILPLYIVLLLTTPALLVLARRNDWLMLAASASLYAVARLFAFNLPTWPLDGGWYFNPLAWQLIFAIGLFIGRRARSGGIGYDRRLFAACLALVVAAGIAATDGCGLVPGLWEQMLALLDHTKTDLGLVRLVHFLAVAYVISHSGLTQLLRATPIYAPLALMGRFSLPVFATGCVLTAVGEVIVVTRPEDFIDGLTLGGFIVAGGIVIHYLVARLLAAQRASHPHLVAVLAAR